MLLDNATVLSQVYTHVDNGGPLFTIQEVVEDEAVNTYLVMDASYHGYPSVSSCIDISVLSPENLRDLGKMFTMLADRKEKL